MSMGGVAKEGSVKEAVAAAPRAQVDRPGPPAPAGLQDKRGEVVLVVVGTGAPEETRQTRAMLRRITSPTTRRTPARSMPRATSGPKRTPTPHGRRGRALVPATRA